MEKDNSFKDVGVPQQQEQYTTEEQVRNLIAIALANYTGVVRFQTLVTTVVSIADFTNSQHTHANAAGGGQLTDTALSAPVTVPKGGSGVNSITGIVFGNGAANMTAANITGVVTANGTSLPTATVPLSGTKTYWVSDTNGGVVNRKLTFVGGILTAET